MKAMTLDAPPVFYPAAMYHGNDDSAISTVEVLMKSSFCLHLPRAMDPYCWARSFSLPQTPLSLYSTSILSQTSLAVIRLGLLGITVLLFFVSVCSSLWLLALFHFSSPYLSPSGPANIEPPLLTIVLSHTVFSLSHNLHLNETQWEKLLVLISEPHADKENPLSPVSVP